MGTHHFPVLPRQLQFRSQIGTYFRSRAEWRALRPSIFQARYKGCNSRCPRYRPRRESCCQNHTLHHRPPGRKPLISDSSSIPPEVFQAGALPRQSGLLLRNASNASSVRQDWLPGPIPTTVSFLIPQRLLLHTGSPVQGSRLLLQNTLLPASVCQSRQAQPSAGAQPPVFPESRPFAAILRHEDADMVLLHQRNI